MRQTLPTALCVSTFFLLGMSAGRAGPWSVNRLRAQSIFNRDIKPLLASRCYACHGPWTKANRKGKFLPST